MKRYLIVAAFFAFVLTGNAQTHEILFAEHYALTDQSFDGKYSGFLHNNDTPYILDEMGMPSGKHITFYENGTIEGTGMYNRGVKHGVWVRYADNGTLISQAYYNDGKKDGPWKIWDEQGNLRFEMHYKNGKRVKTWNMYDENGELIETNDYGK